MVVRALCLNILFKIDLRFELFSNFVTFILIGGGTTVTRAYDRRIRNHHITNIFGVSYDRNNDKNGEKIKINIVSKLDSWSASGFICIEEFTCICMCT